MKSKVAITFALPEESKDFVRRLQGVEHLERGALPVTRGNLEGRSVLVFHTGVGPVSCGARIAALFNEEFEFVIAAGFAGGLDPRLQAGQLILATNYSEDGLSAKARLAQPGIAAGMLTSQASVVECREAKEALREETGASAVDMETETISKALGERRVPLLAVRSVSDAAGDTLAAPYHVWFDPVRQRPRVASLLFYLATHPGRVAPFIKFVGNVTLARRHLTEFLLRFLREN